MAVKSMKEKLDKHDSTNSKKKTKIELEETPISQTESVMIYGSDVIYTEDDKANPPYSLQNYQGEQFCMCPPFGTSNGIANNSWMNDEDEPISRFIYHEEWLRLYKDLSSIGMVYLTPTHPKLQDQVYISNGLWIPFHDNRYCVMPNFKAEGRKENAELGIPGENSVNEPFMKMLGYETVHLPEEIDGEPCYFEGSADIKMINCDNPHAVVYVCGVGIRTSENAARWIENWLNEVDEDPNSAHKVISYIQTDEDEYHLDCSVEPLDVNHTLVRTIDVPQETLDEIAKYTTIIPCDDEEILKAGLSNFLRAGNCIMMGSDIQMLDPIEYPEDYEVERRRVAFMQDICNKLGLELNVYCLSEGLKGGAMLSCDVCDLRGWAFIKEKDWAFKY